MATSQRQQHAPVSSDDRAQTIRERFFLITFLFGAISLVAGMFWIANGLSDNFRVDTTTFIVFATAAALTAASIITSKVLTRGA